MLSLMCVRFESLQHRKCHVEQLNTAHNAHAFASIHWQLATKHHTSHTVSLVSARCWSALFHWLLDGSLVSVLNSIGQKLPIEGYDHPLLTSGHQLEVDRGHDAVAKLQPGSASSWCPLVLPSVKGRPVGATWGVAAQTHHHAHG